MSYSDSNFRVTASDASAKIVEPAPAVAVFEDGTAGSASKQCRRFGRILNGQFVDSETMLTFLDLPDGLQAPANNAGPSSGDIYFNVG